MGFSKKHRLSSQTSGATINLYLNCRTNACYILDCIKLFIVKYIVVRADAEAFREVVTIHADIIKYAVFPILSICKKKGG